MVQYKIYYFQSRGAGETARLILAYGGQQFEDVRLTQDEFKANYKSKMPFGQLPVLEVDGKQLPQSFAINRYLARKYGLAGKDDFEQAQVDAFGDSIKDFIQEIMPFILTAVGFAEGEKDALYKEKFVPAAEKYFPLYKKYLKEAGNGFFFKSGATWVDFYLAEFNFTLNNFIPDFFTSHPEFKQHVDKVHALPQLQNYLKSRPETKS